MANIVLLAQGVLAITLPSVLIYLGIKLTYQVGHYCLLAQGILSNYGTTWPGYTIYYCITYSYLYSIATDSSRVYIVNIVLLAQGVLAI